MPKPISWMGQALLYGLFALIIGYFSTSPPYHHLPPGEALIKLSFSQEGKRISPCHQRTPEELAKLAPNMRAPMDCPRERSPITVEIDLDGTRVFHYVAEPSGLSKDGASTVYHRFAMPAGEHHVAVRLKDDARSQGFDYHRDERVNLKPGKVLVIDFDPHTGGITLR